MKQSGWVRTLLPITLAVLFFPALFLANSTAGAPTRGAEEDLRITITVEFDGLTHYFLHAEVDIYRITIEEKTFNSTELRSLYSIDPNNTSANLDVEMMNRILNLASYSFSGDEVVVTDLVLDTSSLQEGKDETIPVEYALEVSGGMNLSRFLDPATLEKLETGRTDIFILGMLMSGFEFTRTATLRAELGQYIQYRFPSEWNPLGYGFVDVILREPGMDPVQGYYTKTLDSSKGEFVDHFTFKLYSDHITSTSEEVIDGDLDIDWFRLDRMNISGNIGLGPLDKGRSDALDAIPQSMAVPDTLPPGFIRFAIGEGVIDEEDIADLEDQVSDEIESSLSNKFDGTEVRISSTMSIPGYTSPVTGEDLEIIISDSGMTMVAVRTTAPIELDILEGYDLDDVVGLLNGGLRITRMFEAITDDRLAATLTMPNNLIIAEETPLSTSDGRARYDYSGGFKVIGSELAPVYSDEKIAMEALIDLSSVRSHYISDMEIDVKMNGTISVHRIRYNPDEYDVTTELDYELDYLTSDLIRLLDRMGMVNRSEVEDKVRKEVVDLIDTLFDEEGREIAVTLVDGSMEFDGDPEDVNDEDPILIEVNAKGITAPLTGSGSSNSMGSKELRFLPPHLNPLIPVRTVTKTIDTSEIRGWENHLSIRFPSGSGVRAWMGDGSRDKISELEVKVIDGYPTLMVGPEDGTGDHITLELTVGTYFAFNNVSACFFSTLGALVLVILLIVLLIIRGIVRRKKKKAAEADDDASDEDTGAPEEKDTTNSRSEGAEEALKW
ncbi:MAG: hypothetical protein ACMUHM_03560 [Thermoplasmatota archaeon]